MRVRNCLGFRRLRFPINYMHGSRKYTKYHKTWHSYHVSCSKHLAKFSEWVLLALLYLELVQNDCSEQDLGSWQGSLEDQALSKISQGHWRTHNWDYSFGFLLSWKHTSLIKDFSTQTEPYPPLSICLHSLGNFCLVCCWHTPLSTPTVIKQYTTSIKTMHKKGFKIEIPHTSVRSGK